MNRNTWTVKEQEMAQIAEEAIERQENRELDEPRSEANDTSKRRLIRHNTYLVTIKPHALIHHTKASLDMYLARTVKKLTRCKAEWSCINGYEEDTLGRMHLHTIVKTQGTPLFSKVNTDKKVQVHFRELSSEKDRERGARYVLKYNQGKYAVEQRFDANFIRFKHPVYKYEVSGSPSPAAMSYR